MSRPVLIVIQMFPIGNISYFNSRCLLFQSNIARLEKCRTLDLNASLGLYLTLYAIGDKEDVWNLDIGYIFDNLSLSIFLTMHDGC